MKKTNLLNAGILAAALSTAGFAQAQEMYVGGNYAMLEYSEDGISDEASPDAIYGRFGVFFNENISLEGRLGLGVGEDEITAFSIPVDVSVETFYSIIGRAGFEAGDVFYPYVAIGYTRGEVEAEAAGFSVSESESDVSLGVGADFRVSDAVSVNLEYMNYYDKDGAELSGFALGVAIDI